VWFMDFPFANMKCQQKWDGRGWWYKQRINRPGKWQAERKASSSQWCMMYAAAAQQLGQWTLFFYLWNEMAMDEVDGKEGEKGKKKKDRKRAGRFINCCQDSFLPSQNDSSWGAHGRRGRGGKRKERARSSGNCKNAALTKSIKAQRIGTYCTVSNAQQSSHAANRLIQSPHRSAARRAHRAV
jgi:hypothetical protein